MRQVFADTLYWVAVTHRKDQWHQAAINISRTLGGCQLVTTDDVLSEVLTAFCAAGPALRQRAATLIRTLHQRPTVVVYRQSRQTFLTGLALYETRSDKEYSLTDCISMEIMRQNRISEVLNRISEVLTHDHHFTQEGFTALL